MSDVVMRLRAWRPNFGNMPGGRMLDEAIAEIARLTAEVKLHRMTEQERGAASEAAGECDHDNRAMAVYDYLARTAPKEQSDG